MVESQAAIGPKGFATSALGESSIDDQYADLDPTAPTTHWDGQRLDLGYAVTVLAHRRDRARETTTRPSRAS